MLWFKSLLNGIGTGAGVAWPLFGIVFTLLGGLIGGSVSLVLGCISLCLFSAVALAIFYFSYQEMKSNDQQIQEQFKKNEQKLVGDINAYIQSIHNCYLNTNALDFNDYFKCRLHRDLEEAQDSNSSLYQILLLIDEQADAPRSKLIVEQVAKTMAYQSAPVSKVLIPAFFSFVGTFGSTAGCSAGFSGLLTGIGLFSSFAAVPLLGWGIIGAATVCGLFTAINSAIAAGEAFKMTQLNLLYKRMHKQLRAVVLDHHLEAALHQTVANLPITVEEQELFTQKNKPVFSSFYVKGMNQVRERENTSAFFNAKRPDNTSSSYYSPVQRIV